MAVRWRDPAVFRASPGAAPTLRPSRRQAVALLAVIVLVAGTLTAVGYLVRPSRARAFDLFGGSVLLADAIAPVSIDLASGKPTVRLVQAAAQVGDKTTANLSVVPLQAGDDGQSGGALLLNSATGEFNMVGTTGFVLKTDGGVPIAAKAGSTGAVGIADGALAYIEQTGPTGTSVYLVDQSTVQTATGSTGKVRPRALLTMSQPGSTSPGNAVSANGDLWLLLGSGSGRTVRRLHLPADSDPGVTLASRDEGRLTGPVALESVAMGSGDSTTTAAGAGHDVVAAATGSQLRIFGDGGPRTVRFPAVAGADEVLAASNAQDRVAFLIHGSAGWSAVSARTDGTGLRGPVRLTGIPTSAPLAPPAMSEGHLYTVDTASGTILDVEPTLRAATAPGTHGYPLVTENGHAIERASFGDAYLIARGPRVIVNSPSHLDALALFTDGSRGPLVIAKSSAVAVNAASSAVALTRSRLQAGTTKSTSSSQPRSRAATAVNNAINCKDVHQKPLIPVIVSAVPGSRSAQLAWTYPTPDPQSCEPSTYVVSVRALTAGAPSAPGSVTVESQTAVNLSGLFPSTTYSVTVTAYINGVGTASQPRLLTTGPEGPAAPTGVTVSTSGSTWTVGFSSCGSERDGCVPASSWKVIPQLCGSNGLSNAPSPVEVAADPTSRVQPSVHIAGGSGLLGQGLSFEVEGTGTTGAVGEPSAATACAYSWSTPDASAMSLHASTAAIGSFGQTTTATVSLDLGSDPVEAEGGVGATFTYTLLSGSSVVDTTGPTSATTVHFGGIAAGRSYSARAVVAAPRHPTATATVGPVALSAAQAPWPSISVTANATDAGALTAKVTVSVTGLSSSQAGGETFDLAEPQSALTCGNTSVPLDQISNPAGNFDPAGGLTLTVDRTQYYGNCTVRLALQQDPGSETDPAYFGSGTTSQTASTGVQIDTPSLTGGGQFTAEWDGTTGGASPQSQVQVTAGFNLAYLSFTSNWSLTVMGPNATTCSNAATSGPDALNGQFADIPVYQTCVDQYGSQQGWTVQISYDYAGTAEGPYSPSVTGTPATNPQCTPSTANPQLTAQWGGSPGADTVTVTPTVAADRLNGCGNWSFTLNGPTTTTGCGTANGAPPQTITPTCSDTPTTPGWTVTATWTDTSNAAQTATLPVTGTPP